MPWGEQSWDEMLYGTVLADWADDERSALAAYLTRLNSALDAHVRKG